MGRIAAEEFDRRLFLWGLMLTSSGLVVPKPVLVQVPRQRGLRYIRGSEIEIRFKDALIAGIINDIERMVVGRGPVTSAGYNPKVPSPT